MLKKFKVTWQKFLDVEPVFIDVVYAFNKDSARHMFSHLNHSASILSCQQA